MNGYHLLGALVVFNWWLCFWLGRRLGRREGWMEGAKLMGPPRPPELRVPTRGPFAARAWDRAPELDPARRKNV